MMIEVLLKKPSLHSWWAAAFFVAACTRGEAAPLVVPAPTRAPAPTGDMRYLYWEPAVALKPAAGESIEGLAKRVLASREVSQVLHLRAGVDTFVFKETTKDGKVVFQQAYVWGSRTVPVGDNANLSVELVDGNKLASIGSGFRADINLPNKPGTALLDEPAAGEHAARVFEAERHTKGVVAPHIRPEPGVSVQRGPGGDTLAYWILVDQANDGADGSMFLVDAFSGSVLRSHRSSIE